MAAEPTQAIEIFFSYAHEDELLRHTLEKHLSNLKSQGLITGWHDRNISAGQQWAHEIDRHLNSAQLILLLISADFTASDYCQSVEMKRAMESTTRKKPSSSRSCCEHVIGKAALSRSCKRFPPMPNPSPVGPTLMKRS